MRRTNQVSRTLSKQTLIDLSTEVGTYAGTAFGESAAFNERGQGRPLPRVGYEAATAALKCTAYHGSGADREGDIGKAATAIENISIFFSTD